MNNSSLTRSIPVLMDIHLFLDFNFIRRDDITPVYHNDDLSALAIKELGLAQDTAPHVILVAKHDVGCIQSLSYHHVAKMLTATFAPKENSPLQNKICCMNYFGLYTGYSTNSIGFINQARRTPPTIERAVEALESLLGGVDGIGPKGAPSGIPKLITTFVNFGNHWAAISIEIVNGKYYACLFDPVGSASYREHHNTLRAAFGQRYGDNLIWQDNDVSMQNTPHGCGPLVHEYIKLAARTVINGGSIAANFRQFIQTLQNTININAQVAEQHTIRQDKSLYLTLHNLLSMYLKAIDDRVPAEERLALAYQRLTARRHVAHKGRSEYTHKIMPHAIIALTTVSGFFALQYLAQELIWGGYIAAAIVGAGISISYAKATDSGDTTIIIYGTGSGLLQYGAIHGAHYGCEALLQAYCSDSALLSQAPAICGITAVVAGLAMAAIYTIISINIENAKCC